jgi:YbbR domain-containing protein
VNLNWRGWLFDDWRLKLLALVLAVLMLGAVAFSQNPPTTKTFTRDIAYSVPPDLIVLNPPQNTTVTVTGLADVIGPLTPRSVTATFDLSRASPGTNVNVDLLVKSLVTGVTVQNPSVPYALNIDRRATVQVPVQVRVQRTDKDWTVTKAEARCPAAPCSVTFDGPASWEGGLKAYADFTQLVQNTTYDAVNQPVILADNNGTLDLSRATEYPVSLDPLGVDIRIEARTGTTSRSVALVDSPPTHGPAAGYRVTAISVDPVSVVISGDANLLAGIKFITLPAVDLSGRTSDATFTVQIPYSNGTTGTLANATLRYSISANPSG